MPYIGNTIRAADDYRLIDDISSSFNGSTTSFALQVAGSAPVPFPKSPQQVLISVNGVIQEPDPTGASGFNLVGTNIVFSSAPTNGHAFFGIIYATADYLNAGGNFPSGSLGAPSITFIGDENSGLYRKSGGSVGFVSDATEIANFDSNGITISSGNLIITDSIIHSGDSNTKIRFSANDRITIETGGSERFRVQDDKVMVSVDLKPDTDSARDLGTNTNRFANGYFDTLYGDGSNLTGINTDLVSDTSPQLGGDLDANTKNILFGDSSSSADDRIKFGASTDLQIFHDGNSKIQNSNNGCDLRIISDTVELKGNSSDEMMLKAVVNNQVELYHNNSKKFETISSGVTISGNNSSGSYIKGVARFTPNDSTTVKVIWDETGFSGAGAFQVKDGVAFTAGDSSELQIYHDGTTNLILTDGPNLKVGTSGETFALFRNNNAVELYYDNTKRVSTTSNGAEIVGSALTLEDSSGTVISFDESGSRKAFIGIRSFAAHNGDGIMIQTSEAAPIKFAVNNAVKAQLNSSGHFLPGANNASDLGSTSLRWANLYINDLQLSNKGSSNDVDQTWGDYTIQEGFEDLFLINNRTGKKFKFNLTEVA